MSREDDIAAIRAEIANTDYKIDYTNKTPEQITFLMTEANMSTCCSESIADMLNITVTVDMVEEAMSQEV